MNNLFIISILIGLCIGLSNAFHMLGQSKVVLSNQLEHNKLLKVHCRSGDDDLGEQIVKLGEEYEFTFGDNIWGTTRFSCQMDQGPNFRHHQDFVAYETSWSKALEATCQWIAREDGIYFSQDGNPPTKKYEWNGPHILKN
ncbi:putative S-protein1 [Cardamine amara subsp. amara]|uniref:S-protein homolog n=1 Tax=Cardamine amara subsp. amara TaxID=228776 RepID=A0ABD1AJ15_CARAN